MESRVLSLHSSTMSILTPSSSLNSRSTPLIAHLLPRRLPTTLHLATRAEIVGTVIPRRRRLHLGALCAASGGGDGSAADLGSDVIVLDVKGMMCGGCESSVKKILESQPQVSSATANHTTETAVVWPVSEAKASPDWQKDVGEALAKHLTTCGFTSNLRDQGAIDGDARS